MRSCAILQIFEFFHSNWRGIQNLGRQWVDRKERVWSENFVPIGDGFSSETLTLMYAPWGDHGRT